MGPVRPPRWQAKVMNIRVPLPLAAILLAILVVAAVLLLGYPRLAYMRQTVSSYEAALALWRAANPTRYTAVVVSDSLTQPTGGTNTIRVERGRIVSAENPQCPNCPIQEFDGLTIESLFQRIERECLHDFPNQLCNVAYDRNLGYPLRLDTYPYNREGQERPSITVDSVLLESER